MTPQQQEKLLKRIDTKLTALLNRDIVPEKKAIGTWVTAKFITNITGWTRNEMYQARKSGWVEFKRSDTGGYLYLVESINDRFIKKAS